VLFIHDSGQQQNRRDKKCRQIDDNFDNHADAAVLCGVHCPMKHDQGFTRSQWMLPLGECFIALPRRPPWLSILNKTHKTLIKHNF